MNTLISKIAKKPLSCPKCWWSCPFVVSSEDISFLTWVHTATDLILPKSAEVVWCLLRFIPFASLCRVSRVWLSCSASALFLRAAISSRLELPAITTSGVSGGRVLQVMAIWMAIWTMPTHLILVQPGCLSESPNSDMAMAGVSPIRRIWTVRRLLHLYFTRHPFITFVLNISWCWYRGCCPPKILGGMNVSFIPTSCRVKLSLHQPNLTQQWNYNPSAVFVSWNLSDIWTRAPAFELHAAVL